MPDVHAGKGCTIGTTMTVTDKAVPNVVGVDIGCGMYTTNLGKIDVDFERLDEAAHFIKSGMTVWDSEMEPFDLTELRCYESLQKLNWLKCSLGTLGGGNHFIEVDASADGTKYLVIHTIPQKRWSKSSYHYLRSGRKKVQLPPLNQTLNDLPIKLLYYN